MLFAPQVLNCQFALVIAHKTLLADTGAPSILETRIGRHGRPLPIYKYMVPSVIMWITCQPKGKPWCHSALPFVANEGWLRQRGDVIHEPAEDWYSGVQVWAWGHSPPYYVYKCWRQWRRLGIQLIYISSKVVSGSLVLIHISREDDDGFCSLILFKPLGTNTAAYKGFKMRQFKCSYDMDQFL